MKAKHIIVVLMAACMTVATVEAKGTGSCKGNDGKKCACSEGGKEGKKDCTKSEGQSCPGMKQANGRGSCQK